MDFWLSIIRSLPVRSAVAPWLVMACIAMHAQESKLERKPLQKPAAVQHSLPAVKDQKAPIADAADSASCAINSDGSEMAIKTNDATLSKTRDDRDQMTKAGNNGIDPGETLN